MDKAVGDADDGDAVIGMFSSNLVDSDLKRLLHSSVKTIAMRE